MKKFSFANTTLLLAVFTFSMGLGSYSMAGDTIISVAEANVVEVGDCFYCRDSGSPDNSCEQASGTGWTGCAEGFRDCGFYGDSCSSGGVDEPIQE